MKNRPFCVWDYNLRESNLEFIQGIDPYYFRYTAEINAINLVGERKQSAALAIRLNYFHAMESFFSLLLAALQAPDNVAGWLHRYPTKSLLELVATISKGTGIRTKFDFPNGYSWSEISNLIHYSVLEIPAFNKDIIQGFASCWSRISKEFTDNQMHSEYNSIKHGFRVRPGGMSIKLTFEHDPNSKPVLIDESIFGSSFLVPENLSDDATHFRLKQWSVNWDPYCLIKRIEVLSYSMNNVISFLKMLMGVPPEDTLYGLPDDPKCFIDCFSKPSGIKFSTNANIAKEDIIAFPDEEILSVYNEGNKTKLDG